MGSEPDEIHGKRRIRIQQYEMPVERVIVCFGIIQYAKPLFFVRFPESQPFMELFFRDIKALTELFDGMKPRKVLP